MLRLRLTLSALAVVVFFVTLAEAQTTPYRFDLLADTTGISQTLRFGYLPALNDNGTAAFPLFIPGQGTVIQTGTPGDVRAVPTPGLQVRGGLSINNGGRIGFVSFDGQGSGTGNFYTVHAVTAGGPVVTIAPKNTYAGEFEHTATAISNTGAVIAVTEAPQFLPSLVLVGDGTAPAAEVYRSQPLVPFPGSPANTMSYPRMNASGDWLATEFFFQPSYSVLRSNRGSVDSLFSGYTGIGSADVADDGRIVFGGTRTGETQRLYLVPAGRSLSGGFESAVPGSDGIGGTVAINSAGDIASLMGNGGAADPFRLLLSQGDTFDPVLTQGDALLGSTVSSIAFDPKGFNNASQFALLVGLADGRDVFVLASPVPEPAALGMIAVASALLLRRRRRTSP